MEEEGFSDKKIDTFLPNLCFLLYFLPLDCESKVLFISN